MEVSTEKINQFDHEILVRLPAERVNEVHEAEYARLAASVRLPGFRPGKVPRKLLESRFAQDLARDVAAHLVRSSFSEAMRISGLTLAVDPDISEQTPPQKDHPYEYKISAQVMPEVIPRDYRDIPINRPQVTITEADEDRLVLELREKYARFLPDPERQAALGDELLLDFQGSTDGQPIEGGSGVDYPVVLGSGRTVPGFEEPLVGSVAGEEREINLVFPPDYTATHLAGKPARFQCTVKEVRVKRLPEDDDRLAWAVGIREGGVAALRDHLRQQLAGRLAQQTEQHVHRQVQRALMAANPIELPSRMVEEECRRLVEIAKERLEKQGMDLRRMAVADEHWQAEMQPVAKERLAVRLVKGSIAKQEGLQVDEAAVAAFVEALVADEKDPARRQQAKAQLSSHPDYMNKIRSQVLDRQTMDWIVSHGQLTEPFLSLEEFERTVPESPAGSSE